MRDCSLDILVICGGSYVSGMEIAALSVMEGLKNRGHEVRCVVSAWNDGDFPGRLRKAEIPHEKLSLGKISTSFAPKHLWWSLNALVHLPRARHRYRKVLDRVDPDLVLFYGFDAAALLYSLNQTVPTAFHVQELPEGSAKLSFVLDRHASALYIAISEYIAGRLRGLGVDRQQIRVVHNGINVEAVLNGRKGGSHETQDRNADGTTHVGIVGQVGRWKGHEDLVEALALLKGDSSFDEDLVCHVVGTGEDAFVDGLKTKANRYGLSEDVRWHGFVEDVSAIYKKLDIVVVPSRHEEPFGLVAAEAGLWEIPVVATKGGGLPEVVLEDKTGFLVDRESPVELAERLKELSARPRLRRQMGERARKRVQSHFTDENMTEGVQSALCEFASSSR